MCSLEMTSTSSRNGGIRQSADSSKLWDAVELKTLARCLEATEGGF